MYYKMAKILTKTKVNWKTYCKLKYGISEKPKFIYINAHDPNFDLPLSNLYKEY